MAALQLVKLSLITSASTAQTHKSDCVYNGGDFSFTLKWIDKSNGQNQGIFAFTIYPPFPSLDQLNIMGNLHFQCN